MFTLPLHIPSRWTLKKFPAGLLSSSTAFWEQVWTRPNSWAFFCTIARFCVRSLLPRVKFEIHLENRWFLSSWKCVIVTRDWPWPMISCCIQWEVKSSWTVLVDSCEEKAFSFGWCMTFKNVPVRDQTGLTEMFVVQDPWAQLESKEKASFVLRPNQRTTSDRTSASLWLHRYPALRRRLRSRCWSACSALTARWVRVLRSECIKTTNWPASSHFSTSRAGIGLQLYGCPVAVWTDIVHRTPPAHGTFSTPLPTENFQLGHCLQNPPSLPTKTFSTWKWSAEPLARH